MFRSIHILNRVMAPPAHGLCRSVGVRSVIAAVAGLTLCGLASAQDSGYFSGLRLNSPLSVSGDFAPRQGTWSFAAPGLKLGQALEFSPSDATAVLPTTTAFGGYRFGSGLSLGAALSAAGSSVASTSATPTEVRGVGIRFDGARWGEARNRSMNLDVVSAFSYGTALSLYGKLGVARGEVRPTETFGAVSSERTALTYGVGVRYDFTSSLGLKLELSRGTRLGFDRMRTESDPDSINFGVRWSF
ncbi:MAG: porin family protein [Betaproteobacteria bacterium]|nr:MAG: porin family protein [Betaproteobacteria bacterium]